MKIAPNRAVALQYQLKLDNGIIVDSSTEAEPLWYLHGKNFLLPKLEEKLNGLEVGNEFDAVISPKDGYGEIDPQKIIDIAKQDLRGNYELGTHIVLQSKNGHERDGRIVDIQKDKVTVDMNHELAGKTLHFHMKVQTVRAATMEELSHGHVHEGHHHHH